MKHSNTWFALILIASALLLSVGQNVKSESPSPTPIPSPQNAVQSGEQSALPKQETAQHPTPPTIADLAGSPANTPTPSNKGDDGQSNSLLAIGTFIFIALTGVATALIAKFNKQLVTVTDEMKEATATAAKAAEAALHIDRPFLLVVAVQTSRSNVSEDFFPKTIYADIHVKNFGVGPADIINFVANGDLYDWATETGARDDPAVPVYGKEDIRHTAESLVAPEETKTEQFHATISLSQAEMLELEQMHKRIAFHGVFRYRGSPDKIYVTRFFWYFFLGIEPTSDVCSRALDPRLNEHT